MKRIAIVGSGISGLTCAYLLASKYQVTLFEANDYLGGHTHTVEVLLGGERFAVDTGFIVFNDRTYPRFLTLLQRLGVERQATEMSFSVQNPQSGFEYNGHNLNTLFAQRRNFFSPRFYHFVGEILAFNRRAKAWLADEPAAEESLGDFLRRHNFSRFFAEHYLLPMGAAIWSASTGDMREYPLAFFLRFFNNHGLLDLRNRPNWFVIPGGSKRYIAPLTAGLGDGIRLSCPVHQLRRQAQGVLVRSAAGEELFDQVIVACHSDQALRLLGDASVAEKSVLSALAYRNNQVVLHTDSDWLPRRAAARAAWNYRIGAGSGGAPCVTYYMNRLQGFNASQVCCVTLNPSQPIAQERVLGRYQYAHPVFNRSALEAQQRRGEICGRNNTHFCGAYWHCGFHEDGVRSAVHVCQRLGVSL